MESGMDMVTRVAKAIYETEPFALSLKKEVPWEDVHESQKEGFRVKARAAIEAMKPPTPEMSAAAVEAYGDGYGGVGTSDAKLMFEAMIDEALKEHEESGK